MVIAVDFDGTITEDLHDWWKIGKIQPYAKKVLTELFKMGNVLVLWTLRDQILEHNPSLKAPQLMEALGFLKSHDLDFFKLPRDFRYTSLKFPYDVLIDDRNLGGMPKWKLIADYFKIEITDEDA